MKYLNKYIYRRIQQPQLHTDLDFTADMYFKWVKWPFDEGNYFTPHGFTVVVCRFCAQYTVYAKLKCTLLVDIWIVCE